MDVVLWALIGYAAGATPSALIAAIAWGHRDLIGRMDRSRGETDAHIVLRDAGAGGAATAAGVLDVVKAFVPVVVAARWANPYAAAACGIGTVAGHCWPPAWRRFAGRGLAAAAGTFLALLPVEMVIGGSVTAAGIIARVGGLASTIGFVAVPVVAALRHQPAPYRFAAWAIVVLVLVRRLEGVRRDAPRGLPLARAFVRRAVFDVSPEPSDDPRSPP